MHWGSDTASHDTRALAIACTFLHTVTVHSLRGKSQWCRRYISFEQSTRRTSRQNGWYRKSTSVDIQLSAACSAGSCLLSGAEGIEPPPSVLETDEIPLHQAPPWGLSIELQATSYKLSTISSLPCAK